MRIIISTQKISKKLHVTKIKNIIFIFPFYYLLNLEERPSRLLSLFRYFIYLVKGHLLTIPKELSTLLVKVTIMIIY
jgi:hypothetical protein